MKKFDIMGYTVIYPPKMLITINEERNILVANHRECKELHCILDFSDGSILIENAWNIKNIIKDKIIYLDYSSSYD